MVKIIKTITPLVAAVIIGLLEWQAMSHGINGTTFTLAIAGIAGLGGYELKQLSKKVDKEK